MFCNYAVLDWLGQPDRGLFVGTYIGYWLIGAAMLAIGMIASFLTSNITIGFILGVLFNMPLVFLVAADVMFGSFGQQFVQMIRQWSIGEQFADFGHGVLSVDGLAYFAMILRGHALREHGVDRPASLVQRRASLGAGDPLRHAHAGPGGHCRRGGGVPPTARPPFDVTSEKLSSLSPQTVELIRNLKLDRAGANRRLYQPHGARIVRANATEPAARCSASCEALGGDKLQVQIHDTERYSEEAALADRSVSASSRIR